jgi:hypothetical protein
MFGYVPHLHGCVCMDMCLTLMVGQICIQIQFLIVFIHPRCTFQLLKLGIFRWGQKTQNRNFKWFRSHYISVIYGHCTLYPQKLAITSPTSSGRSVGIVHSPTQTMEFSLVLVSVNKNCRGGIFRKRTLCTVGAQKNQFL